LPSGNPFAAKQKSLKQPGFEHGSSELDTDTIRATVKRSISKVTAIPVEKISDSASYVADLGLDSLSILEIAVDVETQFKFQASDEELTSIRTVADTVELVRKRLCAQIA
jgi:acyl carrier protein